jgi:type II secretion system (T2SS) protein E
MQRSKLGDILLSMGAIDSMQLASALAHQRQWGTPLGRTLVEQRFLSQDVLMAALSQQAGLPAVDLDQEYLDGALAELLPRKAAERYRVVPMRTEGKRGEMLVVAIAAPASLSAIDAVQKASGKVRVRALLAYDAAIDRAIGRIYDGHLLDPVDSDASIPLQEQELEMEAAPKERPVLIYGWGEKTAQRLALILAAEGTTAKSASAIEVLASTSADVVVAPLAALELLYPVSRCPAQVVVLGQAPEAEHDRARRLGARAFLAGPLDSELFLRAVRRLLTRPTELPLIA